MRRGWLLLIPAVLLFALLCRLGLWQLDRAAEKAADQARFDQRRGLPPVSVPDMLAALPHAADQLRFRRVDLSGSYDTAHQFLLDNRTRAGVAGYHVYTPLRLAQGDVTVLVNRGWMPVGEHRDRAPSLPAPTPAAAVSGTLELPRADLFLLGEDGYDRAGWPRVVQRIDPLRVGEVLGAAVAPLVVQLGPEAVGGFHREWTAYLGIPPARHRGYAFQWFALAATLASIVVVLCVRAWRRGAAT